MLPLLPLLQQAVATVEDRFPALGLQRLVMPPFYGQDVELLVDALKLAAKLQQRNERHAGGL